MSNPDAGQDTPDASAASTTSNVPADEKPTLKLVTSTPRPLEVSWKKDMLRTGAKKNGPPKKAMYNAALALERAPQFRDALSYNQSALTVNIARPLPWDTQDVTSWQVREWNDNDDRRFLMWLEKEADLLLNMRVVCEAVQATAYKKSFHPIRSYLESLAWDGIPRVDRWLSTYLNAADTPFHCAAGRRWLISGVARIFEPGAHVDCMLILEGKQGTRKSSALRILGGEWFTDEIRALGQRDTSMSLAGKWIVEFAELEAFKDDNLEKLKAFLTRRIDRFRPPYGRSVVDVKRQCVFAGTTNNSESLKDDTGNRRFWPIAVGHADIDSLIRDRDQLWAEARVLYQAGQPWWMESEELQKLVVAITEEYSEVDPWEELIEQYVAKRDKVVIFDLAFDLLEKEPHELRRSEQLKIGSLLRKFGFERKQEKGDDSVRRRVFLRKPS